MHDDLRTLTGREKETLRLLIGGHDAKSAARQLGLSGHTVNERLRDVRRKLGVSSSREAARLLIEGERHDPDSLGDTRIGVAENHSAVRERRPAARPPMRIYRLAWFGGGMLIMSLIVVVALTLSSIAGRDPVATSVIAPAPMPGAGARTPAASLAAAQAWLGLLDAGRWEDSWKTAGALFRSLLAAAQWQSTIEPLRRQLGGVSGRSIQDVTRSSSLPGLPAGDYEVLQFRTSFANKPDAVETVALARVRSGWQVIGYFIK
ncbi:helix-turn-helix domain-containing protein [Sphingomonas sp. 1P08PE]|uniref:helix-turn-helix domain-containing protein n=1 Tax=Sphingomonas sp. 1P08PE TaxID=554122 RepID=UPI0039A327B8